MQEKKKQKDPLIIGPRKPALYKKSILALTWNCVFLFFMKPLESMDFEGKVILCSCNDRSVLHQ